MKIRELQNELFSILVFIDDFCRKNEIKYSLYAGTLLGAVRHHGFIPWDDDIDICMTRDQFERFVHLWNQQKPQGFFLQERESDTDYCQPFSKIRRDHSAYIEFPEQFSQKHTGLFVDIFILDRLRNQPILNLIDSLEWILYLCCIKGFRNLQNRDNLLPEMEAVMRVYRHWFRKKLLALAKNETLPIVQVDGFRTIRRHYSCTFFIDGYTTVQFEGRTFPAMSNWDTYLREAQGDYMKLPPKEKQTWTHHPLLICSDKSCSELSSKEIQDLIEQQRADNGV